MDWIRGLVRPVLTSFMVLGWFILIIKGMTVPLAWEIASTGALAWWFYDRSKTRKDREI